MERNKYLKLVEDLNQYLYYKNKKMFLDNMFLYNSTGYCDGVAFNEEQIFFDGMIDHEEFLEVLQEKRDVYIKVCKYVETFFDGFSEEQIKELYDMEVEDET